MTLLKYLTRVVAVLLVPCLIGDSVMASIGPVGAVAIQGDCPQSESHSIQSIQISDGHGGPPLQCPLFAEQAVTVPTISSRFPVRATSAAITRLVTGGPAPTNGFKKRRIQGEQVSHPQFGQGIIQRYHDPQRGEMIEGDFLKPGGAYAHVKVICSYANGSFGPSDMDRGQLEDRIIKLRVIANRADAAEEQKRPRGKVQTLLHNDGKFAVPERPRKRQDGFRSREGRMLATPELFYGEMVRRAEILQELRPWLAEGLAFDEISAVADNFLRMPRVYLEARADLFEAEEMEKILRAEAFDVDSLGGRLLHEKEAYRDLQDGDGKHFTPEEIQTLLFERLISSRLAAQMLATGQSKAAVVARLSRIGPGGLIILRRRLAFYETAARRLSTILPGDQAFRKATRFSEQQWSLIEAWLKRAGREGAIAPAQALRAAATGFRQAAQRFDAAIADAAAVRDLLFPGKPLKIAVRFLFLTPFPSMVRTLRAHGVTPADFVPEICKFFSSQGLNMSRAHLNPDRRMTDGVWLEPFDRTRGTVYEQERAAVAKLGPIRIRELVREFQTLYRESPGAARQKVRRLMRHGRPGIILAQQLIRPRDDRGGLPERARGLRTLVWETLVERPAGEKPLPVWERKALPPTFAQVVQLGHIFVEDTLPPDHKIIIRRLKIGHFPDLEGKYRAELFDGIPLRIWFMDAAAGYDYHLILDNQTGALRSSYREQLADARRFNTGDLAIETDTDSRGHIDMGGPRTRLLKNKKSKAIATLGPDHPWERVLVRQVDGMPWECGSLQSPASINLAAIVDMDRGERPVRTFRKRIFSTDFNAMTPNQGIRRLAVEGPWPVIGGEIWYSLPDGPHVIDIPRVAKTDDGRTLPLEYRDVKSGRRYPKNPPYFVFVPEPGAPQASFRKKGLFHLYQDTLTPRRLARPTGQAPEDYIVEASLSMKGGTLSLMGFGGMFGKEFGGARVEVKYVGGERRYVKFLHDAAGNPILTKDGLPVVFDLKVQHRIWNWPELMDVRWVQSIRTAERLLRNLSDEKRSLEALERLEAGLREHRQRGEIPVLFRPAVNRLARSLRNAQETDRPQKLERFQQVLRDMDGLAIEFEKALEQDVTPISPASDTAEKGGTPFKRKVITAAQTVRQALRSGFGRAVRRHGNQVIPLGYVVRRAASQADRRLGAVVSLKTRLKRGEVLNLVRRFPDPVVELLSGHLPAPSFSGWKIVRRIRFGLAGAA